MVVWKFNNLYKADAEKVSKEIESISNATPSRILEYARNENSELHKCFEWDDTIAAEKLGVGEMTLRDIVKELTKPGRFKRCQYKHD